MVDVHCAEVATLWLPSASSKVTLRWRQSPTPGHHRPEGMYPCPLPSTLAAVAKNFGASFASPFLHATVSSAVVASLK